MEHDAIKISILVPVYKVPEHYLRRCIESCICQTLQEIQIVLVDDGSPDYCGNICDEYSKLDSRIDVIHQTNKGLSAARNTAYRYASGEYVMFLDGDDYVEPSTCEEAYEAAKLYDVDVVFWDVITDYNNSKILNKTFTESSLYFDKKGCKELQARVLNFEGKIAQVFAKLIRKELLDSNNIVHVETLKQGAEGIVFNVILFEYVTSAYYLDRPLNHYVYNDKSITHSHNEENYYLIIRCFEYIEQFIQSSNNSSNKKTELMTIMYQRLLYVVVTAGISGYFNPNNHDLYRESKRQYRKFLSDPLIEKAMTTADRSNLSFQRRIILKFIDFDCYFPIALLARIRRKQLNNR